MAFRNVGAVLREARERAGLTQSDLARAARMTPNMVSRLEAGERPNPGFATIARLAESLELSLDDIASACGFKSVTRTESPAARSASPQIGAAIRKVHQRLVNLAEDLGDLTGQSAKPSRRRRR